MSTQPEQHSNSDSGREPESPPSSPDDPRTETFDESTGEFRNPIEDTQDTDRQDPVSNTPDAPLAQPEPSDDDSRDQEATEADLESEDSVIDNPIPAPTEMTITLSEGRLSTDLKDEDPLEAITSVGSLSDEDVQRLSRILSEEQSRRGTLTPRPFQHLDFESLALLYNQVRAELGSR